MKIFATKERQAVLDECGIKWAVDQDLNFYFLSKSDEQSAVKALRSALEL